jgi:hypothetical protein
MKTNRSMQIRRDGPGVRDVQREGGASVATRASGAAQMPRAPRASFTAHGSSAIPPGFSNAMSRVCGMVWPVWPDTASSEHDADLAGSDRTMMVTGACGTSVSRHPLLQRTPVGPLDQRRAVCVPI